MAKILVVSDDGQASARVVNTALEDEDPWYAYSCDCTRLQVGEDGYLERTILAAVYHLDHHKVHAVRSPGVGG